MLPSGKSMLFEGKLEDYQRLAKTSGFPDVLDPDTTNPEPGDKEKPSISPTKSSHAEVKELKRARNIHQKAMIRLETEEAKLLEKKKSQESAMLECDPTDFNGLNKLKDEISQLEEEIETCGINWLEASEQFEKLDQKLKEMNRN